MIVPGRSINEHRVNVQVVAGVVGAAIVLHIPYVAVIDICAGSGPVHFVGQIISLGGCVPVEDRVVHREDRGGVRVTVVVGTDTAASLTRIVADIVRDGAVDNGNDSHTLVRYRNKDAAAFPSIGRVGINQRISDGHLEKTGK